MADTQKKNNGTACMQERLMRHCYIVFLCFLPQSRPRLHALGPIVLCVSTIYEYGVCIGESLFTFTSGRAIHGRKFAFWKRYFLVQAISFLEDFLLATCLYYWFLLLFYSKYNPRGIILWGLYNMEGVFRFKSWFLNAPGLVHGGAYFRNFTLLSNLQSFQTVVTTFFF